MLIPVAARQRPELFSVTARAMPLLLDSAEAEPNWGYADYCGTFEVQDGQVEHHVEFSLLPSLGGVIVRRSLVLNGDRLIVAGGDCNCH